MNLMLGLRLLRHPAIVVCVLLVSGCGTEAQSGVGQFEIEPWSTEAISALIAGQGYEQMPADQQAAVADGLVSWAEYEQAMGRVEVCYEESQPDHNLSLTRNEPEPESGLPPTLTIQISHGPAVDNVKMDQLLASCEGQFAFPLALLYQEMHTDRSKFEPWSPDDPQEPGSILWQNGVPTPILPSE